MELDQVRSIIRQTALSESEEDQRQSPFSSGPGKIDTSAIYKLLNARGKASDPASEFIWHNKAPPRVQLFMWLVQKGRIQCKTNLYKKHIIDSPACSICGAMEETTEHLLFGCVKATEFWEALGV